MATHQVISAETWWTGAAAAAVVAAAAAARGTVAARDTTALPAGWWGLAAALWLAADCQLRACGTVTQPPLAATVRLLTVALAVSPAMSLLGAKRPQHGVWQAIVAALGLVLVVPAVGVALARPGSVPDVHLLARAFVVLLLFVGWMNALGTRRWPGATLALPGWIVLARGFLPLCDTEGSFPPSDAAAAVDAARLDALGATLVAAGAAAALLTRLADRRSAASAPAAGSFASAVDPAWFALRDTLGAAWSLRVAERFDQVAARHAWPCRLGLRGVVAPALTGGETWPHDARRVLRGLLLRFVTPAWLERHQWPADRGNVRGRAAHTVDSPLPPDGEPAA